MLQIFYIYYVIEFRATWYTLCDSCRSAQDHVLVLNVLGLIVVQA